MQHIAESKMLTSKTTCFKNLKNHDGELSHTHILKVDRRATTKHTHTLDLQRQQMTTLDWMTNVSCFNIQNQCPRYLF